MTAPKTVSLDDVRAHLSVWNDETLVNHFYHVIDELERRQFKYRLKEMEGVIATLALLRDTTLLDDIDTGRAEPIEQRKQPLQWRGGM